MRAPFREFVIGPMPPDFQLLDSASKAQDALLSAYASSAPAKRTHDIYLWSPLTTSWPSEYYSNGTQVPFYANFIVHLEKESVAATKIEVLEFSPMITLGKSLRWTSHTGPFPAFLPEIRLVSPTSSDREALLATLLRLQAHQSNGGTQPDKH
jgi:hypothetical protein